MKVAALAGGVGGAKLLVGLQRVAGPDNTTAIVNTGDDAVIYGVHVSPDVDIVTYWLAGLADETRGWGLQDDSFEVVSALARLGAETWFQLGDRDFATCVFRTTRLRSGATLSAVADEIRRAMGVPTTILPMSDDPVRTEIASTDGRVLAFQEYFVRERCEPEVIDILLSGIADAKPGPRVVEAVREADMVVVCPSNPLVSIGPILALSGVRDALREHGNVVAVSPLVAGAAIKGPAARMLRSMQLGSTAAAVARLYADFCDLFVVDVADAAEVGAVDAIGMRGVALPIVMSTPSDSEALARAILARA